MNPDGAPGLLASALQAAGRAAVWLRTNGMPGVVSVAKARKPRRVAEG